MGKNFNKRIIENLNTEEFLFGHESIGSVKRSALRDSGGYLVHLPIANLSRIGYHQIYQKKISILGCRFLSFTLLEKRGQKSPLLGGKGERRKDGRIVAG